MRVNHRIWKFVAAFVVVALAPTSVNAVASAHNLHAHDPLQRQITERDNLIFNQESLLNTYRCLFNVDTQVVPGGCVDGKPADDVPQPDDFAGTPTQSEVDTRDNLITNQESLLNTYRCLFNVDT